MISILPIFYGSTQHYTPPIWTHEALMEWFMIQVFKRHFVWCIINKNMRTKFHVGQVFYCQENRLDWTDQFFAYLQHPMSQKQDVVVVLCGGNNICNLSVSPDTIAAELFGRFCGSGSVVVFCSIIRHGNKNFFSLLQKFENLLQPLKTSHFYAQPSKNPNRLVNWYI